MIPSDDIYAIEYLPTSGWVHRVRRFGTSPRELVQPAPSEVSNGTPAAVAEKEDTQPRVEEQRELRRNGWRVWLCWGESEDSIAVTGWSFIVLGVVMSPGMIAFGLWVLTLYRPTRPDDVFVMIAYFALVGIMGCVSTVGGIWNLRLWRRVRRAAQQGQKSIEGTVISWVLFRQSRKTIVKVRADDGETKILRVRGSVNHRVRHVGNRVRIDYVPVSEYVTDVQYGEAPTQIS